MRTLSERKPAPRLRQPPADALKPLEGPWISDGHVYFSDYGPEATWSSREQGEWLWGKRFLLHQWRAVLDGKPFEGMTVFGHSAQRGYFATLYDNAGNTAFYRVEIAGRVWVLAGERQRAVYRYSAAGDAIDIHWDWRNAEGLWSPLCDRRAVRVPLMV